jgi:hypothetical protein
LKFTTDRKRHKVLIPEAAAATFQLSRFNSKLAVIGIAIYRQQPLNVNDFSPIDLLYPYT